MAEDILGISNYLEEELIKHTLGIGAYTPPVAVYAAIVSSITDDGDNIVEMSAPDYTRIAVTWTIPTIGSTMNTADITWPAASTQWGTATAICIYDTGAPNTGHLLYWANLSIPKFIDTSAIFKIPAGELIVALGGAFSLDLRNSIIKLTLRNTPFAGPSTLWAGVGTAVSAYNQSLVEPVGGYGRVQVTSLVGSAGERMIHSPQLQFTAADNWGTITHVGLFDAVSAGNLLYALQLTTPRQILNGDGILFEVDTVGISIQ